MAEKKFTRKEVAAAAGETMFIIENVVYDVKAFLDEHPGGHEVLVNVHGKDASEDFQDIGHSLDARELMRKYRVGELVEEDRVEVHKKTIRWEEDHKQEAGFLTSWKFPVLVGLIATLLYSYLFA